MNGHAASFLGGHRDPADSAFPPLGGGAGTPHGQAQPIGERLSLCRRANESAFSNNPRSIRGSRPGPIFDSKFRYSLEISQIS
jgi:hypothetical protein